MTLKNVLVGKGGMAIRLDPSRWNQYPTVDWISMLSAMAICNPDTTFWATINADFKKNDWEIAKVLFPHGNVRFPPPKPPGRRTPEEHVNQFVNWLLDNNVSPDAGVFDTGSASRVNLQNSVPLQSERKPGGKVQFNNCITRPEMAAPPMIAWYMSAPLIGLINALGKNFPWVSIHMDSRSDLLQRDLKWLPVKSLSQWEHDYQAPRWNATDGFHHIPIRADYAPIHMSILFGCHVKPWEQLKKLKTRDIGIAVNGLSTNQESVKRARFVETMLKACPDIEVFGHWEESHVEPERRWWLTDPRLRGSVPKIRLNDEMASWRSTILSSGQKGWVTAKFYESLAAGIAPIYAHDYDLNTGSTWPKDLRINATTESEIARALDMSRSMDTEALRDRYITQGVLDGTELNQIILGAVDPGYIGPKRTPAADGIWERVRAMTSSAASTMEDF